MPKSAIWVRSTDANHLYRDLAPGQFAKSIEKISAALTRGDFAAAGLKKLSPTPYWRAKLNDEARLLMQFAPHRGEAAFGNSTGDQQMLEYAKGGDGLRLSMIVLHDDAKREYAYGPAQGLPETKVGTFTQALYDEAKKDGWFVISMKDDWKRIFVVGAAD